MLVTDSGLVPLPCDHTAQSGCVQHQNTAGCQIKNMKNAFMTRVAAEDIKSS